MSSLIQIKSKNFGQCWVHSHQIVCAGDWRAKNSNDLVHVRVDGIGESTIEAGVLRQLALENQATVIPAPPGSTLLWCTQELKILTSGIVGWEIFRSSDGTPASLRAIPDFWHSDPATGREIHQAYRAILRLDETVFSPAIEREYKSTDNWRLAMKRRYESFE